MTTLGRDFDHHDPVTGERIHEVFDELRRDCPVAWSDRHGGFWVVTRYQDVHALAHDHVNLSSRVGLIPDLLGGNVLIPISLDPPDHAAYRNLLQGWFTVARVATFESFTRSRARQMLSGLDERCEIVGDFTRPLPLEVMLHLIGVPGVDMDAVAEGADAAVELSGADPDVVMEKVGRAYHYLGGELVPALRREPGDDLISFLATTGLDGAPLPDGIVASIAFNVVGAGYDTTSKTLSSAVAHLATHPEVQRELRARDDLTMAVEELLRLFAPVSVGRLVTRPVECAGARMEPGDRVLLAIPSTGRDPGAFDRPDEVDFDRDRIRHLTFGTGIHRCLGMHLARMELRVMLAELLAATSWFEADPERPVRHSHSQVMGAVEVPLLVHRRG